MGTLHALRAARGELPADGPGPGTDPAGLPDQPTGQGGPVAAAPQPGGRHRRGTAVRATPRPDRPGHGDGDRSGLHRRRGPRAAGDLRGATTRSGRRRPRPNRWLLTSPGHRHARALRAVRLAARAGPHPVVPPGPHTRAAGAGSGDRRLARHHRERAGGPRGTNLGHCRDRCGHTRNGIPIAIRQEGQWSRTRWEPLWARGSYAIAGDWIAAA